MGSSNTISEAADKFVRYIIEGKSQRKAYRKAYPHTVKWKDASVDSKASVLFNQEKVQKRYQELKNKVDAKSILTRLELEQLLKRAALMAIGDDKTPIAVKKRKPIYEIVEEEVVKGFEEELINDKGNHADLKALPGIAEKIIRLNQWDKPKEETSKEDKIGAYFDKLKEAMLDE